MLYDCCLHINLMQDISVGKKFVLAFQTLGVVFGDVGTSPLYTFSVMFRKAPINENEDIIGALSLVLYTLILIHLVKNILAFQTLDSFYAPLVHKNESLLKQTFNTTFLSLSDCHSVLAVMSLIS